MKKENQNNFGVIINGLEISEETRQKIATEIRRTVLNELATLDLKGDLVVKNLPIGQKILNEIGHTAGIWTDYKET